MSGLILNRICNTCNEPMQSGSHPITLKLDSLTFTQPVESDKCVKCNQLFYSGIGLQRFEQKIAHDLAYVGPTGKEGFRYLRKFAELNTINFAKLLDIDAQMVLDWESGKEPLNTMATTILCMFITDKSEELKKRLISVACRIS